ncbi:MAG TPA: MaoC family dehydratase [Pseudonocardiaceae bacterium]|jgi:acyl dehydratase
MLHVDNPSALAEHIGEGLGASDWITVDQDRINGFADVTEDHQWIHVDIEKARTGPFGGPIAHGYLTLSFAPVILAQVVRVDNVTAAVNYGLNKVRFPSPVPVGSRVRGHVSLVSASPRREAIEAVFGLTVEIEGSQRPACVAEAVVLYS